MRDWSKGFGGILTVHHVRTCGSPKDDTRAFPLLAYLHQLAYKLPGIVCIEEGKRKFENAYGVVIEDLIERYRSLYGEIGVAA